MARFGGEREASISVDFDNSTGRELLSGTSEQLLVTAASALYCPEGFSYSASARLCVNAEEALGPFTEAMVADCKRFGGGDSCDNLTWERNFAQNLRGNAECPKGASRTLGGLCVEGGHAYGPFSQQLVETCQRNSGGQGCLTMRWNRSFAESMAPGEQRSTVPYFCQLNNVNGPRSTCGNTSLAMALSAVLGRRITPDFLWTHNTNTFGYNLANSRFRFAEVARSLGANGSRAAVLNVDQMKAELDRGRLLVMQGYFTNSYGHIVLVIGYNAQGFIVHDPFGRWRGGQTGSGYVNCGPGSNTGQGITYSYADMQRQSLLNPQFSVGVIAR